MIILSLLLVLASAALLAAGVVDGSHPLIWASIGASVVAAGALAASIVYRRNRLPETGPLGTSSLGRGGETQQLPAMPPPTGPFVPAGTADNDDRGRDRTPRGRRRGHERLPRPAGRAARRGRLGARRPPGGRQHRRGPGRRRPAEVPRRRLPASVRQGGGAVEPPRGPGSRVHPLFALCARRDLRRCDTPPCRRRMIDC